MTAPDPVSRPSRADTTEPREWRSVNPEITIRWWPRTIWVRIGISVTGRLEPSWWTHDMYRGLVGRIAWPLIARRGPYLLWLREIPKETDDV